MVARVEPATESQDRVRAVLVAQQQLIVLAGVHFRFAVVGTSRRVLDVPILQSENKR